MDSPSPGDRCMLAMSAQLLRSSSAAPPAAPGLPWPQVCPATSC